ncbi:hypothetical protein EDS67_22655 [candidate division KSB1 bacterium]|nr:MAG: hypothetical protein EDS67_22655 [candidate division KSB1 bacterium]MBC6951460.1 hypothetical protein [candidate division KSB1 bacterium]MCE7945089.1 hypothetical protein [Chlorobi bacterium CHB1]MDL1874231.1 hypothetical protein [Cytophagia bacterium CHB2]
MTKPSVTHTPRVAAIYVLELEQIEQKLDDLKKCVLKSRRAARKPDQIHWAHLGDAKHVNSVLEELLSFWQPRFENQPPASSLRK